MDTNLGTPEAPRRTLSMAVAEATAGDTIWFMDGLWDGTVDPALEQNPHYCHPGSGVHIPDGVTLQAVNPGQTTLRMGGFMLCLGSSTVRNLRLENTRLYVQTGNAVVEGVTFGGPLGCGGSGWEAAVQTFNDARVTLRFSGRVFTDDSVCKVVVARQASQATVIGGTFNSVARDGISGSALFVASETAVIRLEDVTIDGTRGGPPQATTLNGTGALHFLRTTIQSFPGSGVEVRDGPGTLTFTDSAIRGGTGAGISVNNGYSGHAVVTLTNSVFDGNQVGIWGWADVTMVGSRIVNHRGAGLDVRNAMQLSIDGGEIGGNAGNGIAAQGTNCNVRLRDVRVTGNDSGIRLVCNTNSTLDLGTLASPGGNTFSGNRTTSLSVQTGTVLVQAVGNVFNANVQGADAEGRYAVAGMGATLTVTTGSGANFNVLSGTLRLAQNP